MLEPRTQISGAVLIVDLDGMNLPHVLQFSPNFAKMLLDWVQVHLRKLSLFHTVLYFKNLYKNLGLDAFKTESNSCCQTILRIQYGFCCIQTIYEGKIKKASEYMNITCTYENIC